MNVHLDANLVSKLPDADMQGAPGALLRASRRAREIARPTNTPGVLMRNGKIVEARDTPEASAMTDR